jgi:hypothetical protein
MPGNRDINDAHRRLQLAWAHVQDEWPKHHPKDPLPFLSEVYRSPDTQRAYYAQGREKLANVNSLRRAVQLPPLSEDANRHTVTNAQVGQSKHQRLPAEAIDIWFARGGKLVDEPRLWEQLVKMIRDYDPKIKWGGLFKFRDKPHFEI